MTLQPIFPHVADSALSAGSFIAGAWRAVSRRHLIVTFLLCLAWGGVTIVTATGFLARPVLLGPAVNAILSMQVNGFAVLFAVLVADRASPPQLRRWWPYVLAVPAGVATGSTLIWLTSQKLIGIATAYRDSEFTFLYRHATHALIVCGMATFVYVSRRFAMQRQATLHAAQLERANVEKRLVESRLAVTQAHVEPQFLRNALSQVERLYESDPQAGDRVLRELIVYLRAAIPQIRDPSSTVGREVRLTNAYLNVVDGQAAKNRLVLRVGETSIENNARMPPMILLPLVSHAIEHRADCAPGETITIDVSVRGNDLRLTVRDPNQGFAPERMGDSAIQCICGRLTDLYASRARLTFATDAPGTVAVLQMPHDIAQEALPS